MTVRLIHTSMPAGGLMTQSATSAEDLIVYCARVSNSSNQSNFDTGAKLLRYLIRNKHWSPFEMVSMCVEIECARSIGRQILRHRSFSFQEFSQRYAEASTKTPITMARLQGTSNRQVGDVEAPAATNAWWIKTQDEVHGFTVTKYYEALALGIAREQARNLLTEGTTSRMYMHGSIRSWIHYLEVRTDEHTQKEHRDIAWQIYDIFCEQFPQTADALRHKDLPSMNEQKEQVAK